MSSPETFSAIASPDSPFLGSKHAALIIGLTSFDGMSLEDAKNYASAMRDSVSKLRKRQIPIVWAAIGPSPNKLVLPHDTSDKSSMALDELMSMSFDEDHGQGQFSDFLHAFMRDCMLSCDIYYKKTTKDTLLDPQDGQVFGRGYVKELLEQSGIKVREDWAPFDHPQMQYVEESEIDDAFDGLFADPSLAATLLEHGIENIAVLGAMGHHCCSETALSAALKGFNTTLVTDRVLSWSSPITTPAERDAAMITWENPDFLIEHEFLARDRLRLIVEENDAGRVFNDAQLKRIQTIDIQGFSGWLEDYDTSPDAHMRQALD